MDAVLDLVGMALLGGGLLLATVGLVGLLRMENIFAQLHAAGLVTGPALLLLLVASVGTGTGELITSAALVAAFVLVTAPLAAHVIADVAHRREGEEPPEEDVL